MGKFVSLKGNRYGITVFIAPEAAYDVAKAEAMELVSSSQMFDDQKIVIGYEGKLLSDFEKEDFTNAISQAGNFECVCILDFSRQTEQIFQQALERGLQAEEELRQRNQEDSVELKKYKTDVDRLLAEISSLRSKLIEKDDNIAELLQQVDINSNLDLSNVAKFYKGNLRSGFVLSDESSLVIVGDVNAGSEVVSAGNIIILGTLRGSARAGVNGNHNAFVFALNMQPMQVSIDDIVARAGDSVTKKGSHEPSIAIIKNDSIAIELATKTVLNDINL